MAHGTILDLGAGTNPDPRATETHDIIPSQGHDHEFDLEQEWPLPDDHADGLIARHVLEHLTQPQQFFHEAGRVLRAGGWLELTVPLGENARTDPDHAVEWTYTTPETYCQQQQRPWDPETEFTLVDRSLSVWFLPPLQPLSPLLQVLGRRWPNWAAYRCGAGELTATYRRADS